MPRHLATRLIPGLIVLAALLAACSDDDGPTTPTITRDTTAPQVVGAYPDPGDVGVSLDDSVFVLFNEAMDPDSADGAITMSAGTVSGFTWSSDRRLAVGHTDWPEGTEITVTVGTALQDTAGNALAAAHVFSFWTWTDALLLLSTTPADGATDVNRDAGIELVFSQDLSATNLASHVTISDIVTKAVFPFTVDRLDDGRFLLDPLDTLPASTTLFVTVAAGLQAYGGATLAATRTVQFTTGLDIDGTPPEIVAFDPADGSTAVPSDQGYLRITFSEPVDPDSIEPESWNLEFFLVVETSPAQPLWNGDHTELTVPLPSDLPAGLPMEVTFVGLRDLAGNVQTTPVTWSAKVQGSADYLPWVDGARYFENVASAWGVTGNDVPQGTADWTEYLQIDTQSATDYRFVEYNGSFTTPTGNWDQFRKTGSAMQWVGFEDDVTKGRRLPVSPDKEIMFSQPLTLLPLPIAAGTWTSSTTVTVPGEGDYTATLQGRVLGRVDYVVPMSGGEVYLKDAWKVARVLSIGLDGTPAFTETDTVWYSPTVGEVHRTSREVDLTADEWYTEDAWRLPAMFTKAWRDRSGF
ncbi:MAG: Ig-like domain-containing protein [Candidatus Krumholzibacteriia bacterium]